MKIICVGHNYVEHIKELQSQTSADPTVFIKPDTALLQAGECFSIPSFSQEIHHEAEVILKINRDGKNISEAFAPQYFDEVTLGIDFTARDLQRRLKEKGLPWEKSKSFDQSAAIGSWVPKNTIDLHRLNFSLKKNGKTVQRGNTREMIFSFNPLIAHVSQYFSLKSGDLIFTGTPAGVGPVKANDLLEGYLEDRKILEIKIL